ncbi:MAG: MFS transporter [Planctomycetaceae bacterium]|jgi:MFS transporter, ACS family, glucarate transporter|nr:MFS transporter [Planctomycetaceae bacterium]MBT6154776.1 MFS transporter [Planctomycetaceae bacterium]MBT6485348.1 MFS transporter [Planctomycetaceae bacterium]MBT6493942.1 MFS transporter [Planctomycetaceae bacterium]
MTDPQERPTNVRWMVFALGCGTSWILYLHRYTFALIKPKLQEEWELSNTELGVLDGAFSICYSLFQFPAGVAADVFGVHLFLGIIILLWSLALGLHAWAPTSGALWYVRALFGTSQAGAYASVSRLSRTWFPASTRTTAQGWMGVFSGRIGGASANILFAAVIVGVMGFDWRTAIWIFAGLGIAHASAFLILFRSSPSRHPWTNRAEVELIEEKPSKVMSESMTEETAEKTTMRQMLGRMSPRSIVNLFSIVLTSTLSTIADNIFLAWIPLFLFKIHGLTFKEMGFYSALPLFGGAFGGAFGGFLNDRVILRTGNLRWARSLIGFGGKGTAGVLLVIALLTSYENPYRFCTFLLFIKFFADISLATRWGAVTDISGNASASVFAFNNSLAGLGGILAPIMYGIVLDEFNWKTVFVIGGVMYGLCAASWLLIDCSIPLVREESAEGTTGD